MVMKPEILYFDNHLVVIAKPAGMLVQGDATGDETLLEYARQFVREEFNKPGKVYMGLVHRLDRPASGVVCFAKTSKAAARLSKQFQQKTITKKYLALVEGEVPVSGHLIDNLERRDRNSFVAKNGKKAELTFQRVAFQDNVSLVDVNLKTGRHHQIRVQFAHRGHGILGDFRYGSTIKFPNQTIGLHAYSLTLNHPTQKEAMTFTAPPPENWPNYFIQQATEFTNEK
ncbi:MAG: RluA family pseudouridine synthase [Fidelibacterota bacterium]